MAATVREPARDLPILASADVVVVGGGAAGVGAAVGAARRGARTILIERYGFLGGTATAGLMACMNGFRNEMPPPRRQVIRGIAQEIADRMAEQGGCEPAAGVMPYCLVFDVEAYKQQAQSLCLESGVELLLHTYFSDVVVSDGRITAVICESKGGRFAITGKVFIDCSGDADLSVQAGAPVVVAGQRNEDQAMPMGLMIRLGGVDVAGLLDYVDGHPEEFHPSYWMAPVQEFRSRWESGRQFGVGGFNKLFRERGGEDRSLSVLIFRDQVITWGGTGGVEGLDPISLTRAEVDSRAETERLVALIKRCLPGFQGCRLLDTGAQIGVRETRRVVGDYQLTEDDVMEGRRQPDAIAVCVNSILRMGDGAARAFLDHDGYDIPFRSLIAKGPANLLVAGRCQSATRRAFGSIRGIAICMVLGQAAGTAGALAAEGNGDPRGIDVPELQRLLVEDGNILDLPAD